MDGGDFKNLVDMFGELRKNLWLGASAIAAGLLVFAIGFVATYHDASEPKYELMAIGVGIACVGAASIAEYLSKTKVTEGDLDLAMTETLRALNDNMKRIVIVTYEDGSYRANATNINAIELVKAGILNPPPSMTMHVDGVFTLNNRWRTFIESHTDAIYGSTQS